MKFNKQLPLLLFTLSIIFSVVLFDLAIIQGGFVGPTENLDFQVLRSQNGNTYDKLLALYTTEISENRGVFTIIYDDNLKSIANSGTYLGKLPEMDMSKIKEAKNKYDVRLIWSPGNYIYEACLVKYTNNVGGNIYITTCRGINNQILLSLKTTLISLVLLILVWILYLRNSYLKVDKQ